MFIIQGESEVLKPGIVLDSPSPPASPPALINSVVSAGGMNSILKLNFVKKKFGNLTKLRKSFPLGA